MSLISIIFFAIVILIIALVVILSHFCFDDSDPDMYWHDNYTVIECAHLECTDVVVESNVTCETIHTICDDCGKIIRKRTEC